MSASWMAKIRKMRKGGPRKKLHKSHKIRKSHHRKHKSGRISKLR